MDQITQTAQIAIQRDGHTFDPSAPAFVLDEGGHWTTQACLLGLREANSDATSDGLSATALFFRDQSPEPLFCTRSGRSTWFNGPVYATRHRSSRHCVKHRSSWCLVVERHDVANIDLIIPARPTVRLGVGSSQPGRYTVTAGNCGIPEQRFDTPLKSNSSARRI